MDNECYMNPIHNEMIPTENEQINLRIGDYAPDFVADTTMGTVKLSDYMGKWIVLFSHPRRFYTRVYY